MIDGYIVACDTSDGWNFPWRWEFGDTRPPSLDTRLLDGGHM